MSAWRGYEWVFSGIGVLAVSGVVGFIRRRVIGSRLAGSAFSPSVTANVLAPVTDSNVAIGNTVNQQIVHHHQPVSERPLDVQKSTEPSPGQIEADLNALPPFERQRALENYRGLPVLWPLALSSVLQHSATWTVMFGSSDNLPLVIVDADFTELPPEIRVAPTDTTVWVRGKIREIRPLYIDLEANPEIVEVKRP